MCAKKRSLMALWCGVGMIVLGFLIPLVMTLSAAGHVDIVGGAGLHTFRYLYRKAMAGLPQLLVQWGIPVTIAGAVCLKCRVSIYAVCAAKTSLLALGLSATGAVGLYCFMNWFAMAIFHERYLHPIAYPFYVSVGLISLCVFLCLLVLYGMCRAKKRSIKGLLLDIATAVLFLTPFLTAVQYAEQMVRGIIK